MSGLIGFNGTFVGGGGSVVSTQLVESDTNFSGTTRDIAITSVNTAATAIFMMLTSGGNGANQDSVTAHLTSSTNLRLTKGSSSIGATLVKAQVIEYDASTIESIQTVSFSGAASGDSKDITLGTTLSSTDNAIVYSHGVSTSETTTRFEPRAAWLTSTTNVRAYVRASGTPTVLTYVTIVKF